MLVLGAASLRHHVRVASVLESAPARRAADARVIAGCIAVVSFLLVLLIRLWLKFEGPLPGERWLQEHLDEIGLHQPWRDLSAFFSVIGGPPVAFATGVVALWFAWRACGVRGTGFVALSCCGVGVNAVLKSISGPTPLMTAKYGLQALNFPSGHTVYAVVLFGSLAWLAVGRRRWDIAAVLIVLIVAMGPFRVVAETHFVSDVVAGYLIGMGCLIGAALATGAGGTSPQFSIRPRPVSPR